MGRRKFKTIPNVTAVALGHKGLCIAKTQEGEAVLVKGAIPGDVFNYQMRKKRNGMKWGVPLEFLSRSEHLVEPRCDHFEYCGGCSWQNFDYAQQAFQKQDHVHQTIQRIGGIRETSFLPIIAGREQYDYRNKMVYSFSKKRWMTPTEIRSDVQIVEPGLGFYAGGSFDKVINIYRCHLQDGIANEIRNTTRDWAKREGYSFYNAKAHEGDLRNLMIRTTRQGEIMLTLVTGGPSEKIIDNFVAEMLQHFPQINTICWMVNTKWNDSLLDIPFSVIYGDGYITESLNGVDFRIGPKSFFQTNPGQAELLFSAVKEAADFNGDEVLYDLYCGVGTIGIYMSEHVGQLVGVEEVKEAIDDAWVNAEINGIENAHFEVGDVRLLVDEGFIDRHGKPDLIITDPPRAGMHEDVVKTLCQNPAPKLIYVSCNPATQARDLQRLSANYEVVSVQPVDMFPQTNHVESIALLKMRS